MTMTPAKIIPAAFTAQISDGLVSPLTARFPFNLPLYFRDVCALRTINGVYRPNNDYRYIFQSLDYSNAPNFLIVVSDDILNLVGNLSGGSSLSLPVSRFSFFSVKDDPANYFQNLYADGRTSYPTPMAQGLDCCYTIIMGRASIT